MTSLPPLPAKLRSHRVALCEAALLVLCAPFLVFPTVRPTLTALALGALALWWLRLTIRFKAPWPASPMNGALLLWVTMVGVGTLVTASKELTMPKTTNLILGIATWRVVVQLGRNPRATKWLYRSLALMSLGIVLLGLVTVDWANKLDVLQPLLSRLPSQLLSVPEAAEQGVNPNQLGGTLALLVPPAIAATVWALQAAWRARTNGRRCCYGDKRPTNLLWLWARAMLTVAGLLLIIATLILTQSRSAWAGAVGGSITLAFLVGITSASRQRRRTTCWIAGAFAVLVLTTLSLLGPERITALWETPTGVETTFAGTVRLAARVEIWSRAIYATQDFAFTGCGLGTFREVIWILYPLFTIPPTTDIAHAHNQFLQVAVDTGLPGLVAYASLLGIAAMTAISAARKDPRHRLLALGLLGGLIALHTFGLTDALAPGAKPGLVFWMMVGMVGTKNVEG